MCHPVETFVCLCAATISVITNDGRVIVVCTTFKQSVLVAVCCNLHLVSCNLFAAQNKAADMMPFMLLQGILRGYDQATNLILDECHERVYSSKVRWHCPDSREFCHPQAQRLH